MSERVQVFSDNFLRGLMDTQPETGLAFPGYYRFQNVRVNRGRGERRRGMVRVGGTEGLEEDEALSFDGTTNILYAKRRDEIHQLRTTWTVECLVHSQQSTGTRHVLGWEHATSYPLKIRQSGGAWQALIQDEDGAVATLSAGASSVSTSAPQQLRVTRSGGTVTFYLDGTQVATDTSTLNASKACKAPGGNLLYGANSTGPSEFFQGYIDYVRAFRTLIPSFRHAWQRWPHPKGAYVLWDHWFFYNRESLVEDQSRGMLHAAEYAAGVGPTVTTRLGNAMIPVQAMRAYVDLAQNQRLCFVACGIPHSLERR